MNQLPRKVAVELLLTGEPLSRIRRLRMGVDQPGHQGGSVVDAALALAARITVNAPLSVQASERIAYGVDDGIITVDETGWQRTISECDP